MSAEIGSRSLQPTWDRYAADLANGLLTHDPRVLEARLDWVWSHLLNEELGRAGIVDYVAELAPADLNDLANPETHHLIARGRGDAKALVSG